MAESKSISEFLNKISTYEVKDGDLEYKLINDNTIIAKHHKCFCGQVKLSKENHTTDTYCQCSVEFNRQFFMAALDKSVDVKLKSAILNGDDYCTFEITF
ncbi:MAG: hypothetical protein KAQ68_09290 [Clostridiales bacterium]|nr:hypothetical protein [Clostridiales bacterium]